MYISAQIRVSDGRVISSHTFHNDFISLESGGGGVSVYEDLILLLSLPTQTLWILQIRNDGQLVVLKQLGEFMRDDDILRVRVQENKEARFEEDDDEDDDGEGGGENKVRQSSR